MHLCSVCIVSYPQGQNAKRTAHSTQQHAAPNLELVWSGRARTAAGSPAPPPTHPLPPAQRGVRATTAPPARPHLRAGQLPAGPPTAVVRTCARGRRCGDNTRAAPPLSSPPPRGPRVPLASPAQHNGSAGSNDAPRTSRAVPAGERTPRPAGRTPSQARAAPPSYRPRLLPAGGHGSVLTQHRHGCCSPLQFPAMRCGADPQADEKREHQGGLSPRATHRWVHTPGGKAARQRLPPGLQGEGTQSRGGRASRHKRVGCKHAVGAAMWPARTASASVRAAAPPARERPSASRAASARRAGRLAATMAAVRRSTPTTHSSPHRRAAAATAASSSPGAVENGALFEGTEWQWKHTRKGSERQ